jgi:choline-sulfatase
VLYTSDHGEMLGKFGMWWKCSLYDDSVRVPCVVAGPDFPPRGRVRTPVSLLDLQASLFQALGAARPADWVGTPLGQIPPNDPRRAVFSEYHGHGTRASAYMIRRGRWKYIHYVAAPDQLFDLEADPDELHDLRTTHPHIVRELRRELEAICSPGRENERAESFIAGQLETLRRGLPGGGGPAMHPCSAPTDGSATAL